MYIKYLIRVGRLKIPPKHLTSHVNAPLLQIDFLCSNPLSQNIPLLMRYIEWIGTETLEGKCPEKYCVPIL